MVELKNGKVIDVVSLADVLYYIEEEMGADFAKECEYVMGRKIDDAEEERDIYKQELESYERSAERYTFALSDALNAVEEMMQNTRITKLQKPFVDTIYNAVKNF